MSDNPTLDAIDGEQVRSVGTAFLRLRPLLVAPAGLLVLGVTQAGGASWQQLAAIGILYLVVIGFFGYEAWRLRTTSVTLTGFARSLSITVVLIACLAWFTGALDSPLLPVFFAPVVVGLAAFGRSRKSLALMALFVAAFALLALGPWLRPFEAYASWQMRALTLGAFALSLALIATGVVGLVDAHRRAAIELDRLRARALHESVSRTRDLETVSAKVAHEIRNPLVSIKGLVQLLSRGAAGEREQKRFAVALSEIERLEAIVADYLSFARPFDGLRAAETDLGAVLAELGSVLEARAAAEGVRLRVATLDGVKAVIDETRLKQALLNLLLNAIEATPRGGTVELGARRLPEAAEITIEDRGAGMEKQQLERVGTAFFTTRQRGTGLGVAIARGIVQQHGGSLHFESEVGRGTKVTACLPLSGSEPKAIDA